MGKHDVEMKRRIRSAGGRHNYVARTAEDEAETKRKIAEGETDRSKRIKKAKSLSLRETVSADGRIGTVTSIDLRKGTVYVRFPDERCSQSFAATSLEKVAK